MSEPLYEVAEIDNAGYGLVAKADLHPGQLLLHEAPLVTIEASVKSKNISWSEKCSYLKRLMSLSVTRP